jgi:SOS-response transcriptional repressor LexA
MEPEFVEGDIIIVNPHIAPKPEDFVIVKNEENGEVTFKQLKRYGETLILYPLNPKCPDIEITPRYKVRIIGKVVEKKKRY